MAPLKNNTLRSGSALPQGWYRSVLTPHCKFDGHLVYADGYYEETLDEQTAKVFKRILEKGRLVINSPIDKICQNDEDYVIHHVNGDFTQISSFGFRKTLMEIQDEEYRHRTQLNSRLYSLAVNGLPAQDIVPAMKIFPDIKTFSPFSTGYIKEKSPPAHQQLTTYPRFDLRMFDNIFVTKCDKCGLGRDVCDGKVNRKGRCTRQEGLFWEKVGKLTKTRQGNNKTAL